MISYLLTFDANATTREKFVSVIDSIAEIENWMLFFDNTACIVSPCSARDLTTLIRAHLPETPFLITELTDENRAGWLKQSVWNFIREPKRISA